MAERSDPATPRLLHRGYRAEGHLLVSLGTAAQSQEAVIQEMFEEAGRWDPKGQKRWVALVDGNLPQIDRLQQLAEERKIPP